jgi:hypothetical protein
LNNITYSLYLQTTTQRIVRNLNDIDEEIDLEVNDDVDMEGAGTTIREMFMKHLDNKCNVLFHNMEHTNTSGVYRLLFDETNTEQVDTLLTTIDESLNALGDWDNADAHLTYHSNEKSEHRRYTATCRKVRLLEGTIFRIREDNNSNCHQHITLASTSQR